MPERQRLGLTIVMISDTHGEHRKVHVPPGDILIHAGDFTRYGSLDDARDFNAWLAEQPHAQKLVVLGNHEANVKWSRTAAAVLTNATLLRGETIVLRPSPEAEASAEPIKPEGGGAAAPEARSLSVHGTDFFWPMKTPNPHYAGISEGVDVLIAHGPVAGHVDGGFGCEELLRHCKRVRPRLVVSGHIHGAHGVVEGAGALRGTTFVNAANALKGHAHMGWPAVTVEI